MVERTLISFPSQLQLIERLQHLLYLSSSMIFISGEAGSGKSTLIEQLSNHLPNKTQQAFITLSEPTSAAQIRQKIISQLFEQPLFDADDSLGNILLLLKDKLHNDIARVIVIDNARLLPEELLSELAEVITQKSVFTDNEINFILLSDEASNEQMVSATKVTSNNQDIAALTFKLAPLSPLEAKQLLKHRFEQIGYSPQVQHQDALATQLSLCHGIPEKILSLATAVSSGDLACDKPSWFKTRLPAILFMLLLVAIASLLATYLYPQFIKEQIEVETIVETDSVLLAEIVAIDVNNEPTSAAQATEVLAGNWSNNNQAVTDNLLSVGEADNQERVVLSERILLKLDASEAQTTVSEPTIMFKEIETVEAKTLLPEAALPATEIEREADEKLAEQRLETQIVDSEIIEEPLDTTVFDEGLSLNTEAVIQAVSEVVGNDKQVVQEVFELQNLPDSQPSSKEAIQVASAIEKPDNNVFTPTSILLAVDKNMFTLQLTGMGSEQTLKEFIERHQLPRQNVYLYQTLRNEKPWYVAIYGQFETRQAANLVAKNLPNTLSNLDSWVKKYASVHQDIQLNEQ